MVSTILLVDDEPGVLEGLTLVLWAGGRNGQPRSSRAAGEVCFVDEQPCRLETAFSAEEAADILRSRPVDVIVSDERMPGVRGTDFLSEVAERYPEVVRIILTGYAGLDAAVRAINHARVFRYLRKPCPPDELRSAVSSAIRERAHLVAASRLVDSAEASLEPALHGLSRAEAATLTPRELEVLRCLAFEGLRGPDIASRLHISRHTVRNHLKALFRKLAVHSQSELIRKARG